MLHPPGPTAKPMMMSRIPARTPPRINVTIPAITRITALIQSSEAVPPFNRATGARYESTTAMRHHLRPHEQGSDWPDCFPRPVRRIPPPAEPVRVDQNDDL